MDAFFDIIGDIHGCYDEFRELLTQLGYRISEPIGPNGDLLPEINHPEGRRLLLVGDLVDRGPDPLSVLKLAVGGYQSGILRAARGNHDDKLLRALKGHKVVRNHGLAETMVAVEAATMSVKEGIISFLEETPSHLWFPTERLAVAHAGIKEEMLGMHTKEVLAFCLYGQVTDAKGPNGWPVRADWAAEYSGEPLIVHGHTPMTVPRSLNNVICIDTGCCFGGSLTAFRFPEGEFTHIPSRRTYSNAAQICP